MSRVKRPTAEYLAAAKALAKFAPALKKYARRRKLTPWEKGAITRKERLIGDPSKLRALSDKEFRDFKRVAWRPTKKPTKKQIEAQKSYRKKHPGEALPRGMHYEHEESYESTQGIHAIRLPSTGKLGRVRTRDKDLYIDSNGRTWVYWQLDRADVTTKHKRGMSAAAQAAFDMQFPIERIAQLAERAFEELQCVQVFLWTSHGAVGGGFRSLKQFLMWLNANWNESNYGTQTERWVNGIAIIVQGDPLTKRQR